MKILATDMDRTLLPNGHWEADPEAIGLFNRITREQGVVVVYVTGRNLALTEAAVEEFGVRAPDILIGDVGTSIRKRDGEEWQFDEGWTEHVKKASPRWRAENIQAGLEGIGGLTEQEAEHQNPFKQSYYADHERRERIMTAVQERIGGRYDEVIIYSYDSMANKGLIDVLPNSATKQTALEYVAETHGCDKGEVVFCGDSGNDIFPLTAGFSGVLVRNADEQLVENVRRAQVENSSLKVYFAKGGYRGLNGYYTSGVLEGAAHYGLIDSDSTVPDR